MSVEKLSVYYKAFAALLFLTAMTVIASFINFGRWGISIALLIATIKALVVIIIFMHVRHATQLLKLFVLLGFLWLIHMMGGTFGDYLTRGLPEDSSKETWIPSIESSSQHRSASIRATHDPIPSENASGSGH